MSKSTNAVIRNGAKAIAFAALFSTSLASSPSFAQDAGDLLRSLKDTDILEQPEVVREIEAMGEVAVPPLIEAAQDGDRLLRYQAIEILGRIGEEANAATPLLIEALTDPESQIRRNAAWALGRVGDDASDAMPALLSTAKDVQWDVRADAVWAVGKVLEEQEDWSKIDGDLLDAVVGFLDDHSHHVRWSAAWSLARFGPGAEDALEDLAAALEDYHPKVRASAAAALGEVAASHHEELLSEALHKAMNDESALVRSRAKGALKQLRLRIVPGS